VGTSTNVLVDSSTSQLLVEKKKKADRVDKDHIHKSQPIILEKAKQIDRQQKKQGISAEDFVNRLISCLPDKEK
jgi:hypothetical protein